MRLKELRGVIAMSHKEKAVEYYNNNFNCSQGVFTAFATELGMDEKLALKLATNFGGGERKGELCGAVAGALMVFFKTFCPKMVESAAEIVNEMITEGIC